MWDFFKCTLHVPLYNRLGIDSSCTQSYAHVPYIDVPYEDLEVISMKTANEWINEVQRAMPRKNRNKCLTITYEGEKVHTKTAKKCQDVMVGCTDGQTERLTNGWTDPHIEM